MNILVQLKILGRMKENNFVVDRLPFSIPKHQVWITMIFGKTLNTLATPTVFTEPNPKKISILCQKLLKEVWNFVKFRQTQISRLFWWVESGQKKFEKYLKNTPNMDWIQALIWLESDLFLILFCYVTVHFADIFFIRWITF